MKNPLFLETGQFLFEESSPEQTGSKKSVRFAPEKELTSYKEPSSQAYSLEREILWWQQKDYDAFQFSANMNARKERNSGRLDECITSAMKCGDVSKLVNWCGDDSNRGLERMCGEKYGKATDFLNKLAITVVLKLQSKWKGDKDGVHEFQNLAEELRVVSEKATKNSKELALLFGYVDAEVAHDTPLFITNEQRTARRNE